MDQIYFLNDDTVVGNTHSLFVRKNVLQKLAFNSLHSHLVCEVSDNYLLYQGLGAWTYRMSIKICKAVCHKIVKDVNCVSYQMKHRLCIVSLLQEKT